MKINGTGCSLVDNLYSPVDFSSERYLKWTEDSGQKNGLITGGLIFGDELEKSSGIAYKTILDAITGGDITPYQNVGGPGIVAIIHMSQILDTRKHNLAFYGARAEDKNGRFLAEKINQFNVNTDGFHISQGNTPFTDVLADPAFNNDNGERTFINYIGAAGETSGDDLPTGFFDADMLIFGGTALTPAIHDDLSRLLKKAKSLSIITCINTVYDFRNQKINPEKKWPLVRDIEDFKLIDLLIMDNEESLKISGKADKTAAVRFFIKAGVHSGIITHGANDFICFSDGEFFREAGIFTMPVSSEAGKAMRRTTAAEADTTGCGDNFAGGVYASLVEQLSESGQKKLTLPSLKTAASLGAVSGGLAGLYKGGVFFEKKSGEKTQKLRSLLSAYQSQIMGHKGIG